MLLQDKTHMTSHKQPAGCALNTEQTPNDVIPAPIIEIPMSKQKYDHLMKNKLNFYVSKSVLEGSSTSKQKSKSRQRFHLIRTLELPRVLN